MLIRMHAYIHLVEATFLSRSVIAASLKMSLATVGGFFGGRFGTFLDLDLNWMRAIRLAPR